MTAHRHRGAALLAAMLTVSLVATLAASALWQQWRGVEVEAAERTRAQAYWILTGALDWSRLILREDGRSGGPDHLAEPWAVPLQEARLSTFLAASGPSAAAQTDTLAGDLPDAFLSGAITDLQGRLNVQNLLDNGQPSEPGRRAFAKLFERLGLPPQELAALQLNLVRAHKAQDPGAPLPPLQTAQLVHLGLSASTLQALTPYISLLPLPTPVNLNTAPPEVLYACIPSLDMTGAQELVRKRALSHFKSIADAGTLLGERSGQINESQHSISSRYFEVLGRLRLDQTVVQERSLVYRNGMDVQTLRRERGAPPHAGCRQMTCGTPPERDRTVTAPLYNGPPNLP